MNCCLDCTRSFTERCPACHSELQARGDGWYCADCGYYRRVVVSEQTLAMTEIRKLGERGKDDVR